MSLILLAKCFEVCFPFAEITYVNNGKKALEILQKRRFDLILMKIQMPELNGYQTTAQIQSTMPFLGNVPIIALCADENALKKDERYIQNGFNGVLGSPITFSKIKKVISKHL